VHRSEIEYKLRDEFETSCINADVVPSYRVIKTGYWLLTLCVYASTPPREFETSSFIILLGVIFVGGILPFLGLVYIFMLIIRKLKE
jgi:hypothetical protein